MNEERNGMTREEQAALGALSLLAPAQADPEARLGARRAFLQGAAEAGPRRRSPFTLWLGALLGAALVVLVLVGMLPSESWRVLSSTAPEGILARGEAWNGEGAPPAGPIEIAAGSELELQWGEGVRIRILGGSRVQLPRGPGRWLNRSMSLEVESGEIFGTTGGELPGYQVVLATPEAEATLTGTTFAAFRTEEHSCFCLYEGGLRVEIEGDGVTEHMDEGRRIFIYRDGREHSLEPLSDMEIMKLQMIRDAGISAAGD